MFHINHEVSFLLCLASFVQYYVSIKHLINTCCFYILAIVPNISIFGYLLAILLMVIWIASSLGLLQILLL